MHLRGQQQKAAAAEGSRKRQQQQQQGRLFGIAWAMAKAAAVFPLAVGPTKAMASTVHPDPVGDALDTMASTT
jgi:hypothetical protein